MRGISENYPRARKQDPDGFKYYLHPDLIDSTRRYRHSDDVYSLGVIILEIALWVPARACVEGGEFRDTYALIETAETNLAAEMGEIYHNIVLDCLIGSRVRGARRSSISDSSSDNSTDALSDSAPENDGIWK